MVNLTTVRLNATMKNLIIPIVIFFALLITIAKGNYRFLDKLNNRIVGGKPALPKVFPYQASLRYNNKHFCGGSIINNYWILTAAHCIIHMNDKEIAAYVGTNKLSKGGVAYQSVKLITHPEFTIIYVLNDIGLIKVNASMEFNDAIQPIPLPTANIERNNYPAVVSGWGQTENDDKNLSDDLQYIDTLLLDLKTCDEKSYLPLNTDKKICSLTKPKEGVCSGDSGGPLIADGKIVGIVSYGSILCGDGIPDVYTRVYSYLDWINKVTSIW